MPGMMQQPTAGSDGVASVRGWLRPSWQAERVRIERLELLDELEEWKLLQVRLECGQQCHSVNSSSKGADGVVSSAAGGEVLVRCAVGGLGIEASSS